jgi:hypothetical protein
MDNEVNINHDKEYHFLQEHTSYMRALNYLLHVLEFLRERTMPVKNWGDREGESPH